MLLAVQRWDGGGEIALKAHLLFHRRAVSEVQQRVSAPIISIGALGKLSFTAFVCAKIHRRFGIAPAFAIFIAFYFVAKKTLVRIFRHPLSRSSSRLGIAIASALIAILVRIHQHLSYINSKDTAC
jgi:hypothetical protein